MTATSKRVLIVDDEDVVCRSYERVLSNAGFEVAKAHSGPEALAQVRDRDFDVILADLKMPGMDGLEVVSKVRESNPRMPVVVITGFPSEDTLNEAARLGVNDYLTKPVAPDVLTHATVQAMATPHSGSVPLDARTFPAARPVTVAAPMPAKLPDEIVWPERPTAAAPVAAPVAEPVAEPVEHSVLGTAVKLALAPVVSLAYVMFLPFIGFALFFGYGTKALVRKLAGGEA